MSDFGEPRPVISQAITIGTIVNVILALRIPSSRGRFGCVAVILWVVDCPVAEIIVVCPPDSAATGGAIGIG